jgi:hydroxypyruvate isomerase
VNDEPTLHRRQILKGALALGATSLMTTQTNSAEKLTLKGRIKHSIVFWCFNVSGEKWDIDKTCQIGKQLGCVSIEIVDPADWGTLKKHRLTCAIAPNGMPGAPFKSGFNNLKFHDELHERMTKTIDACAEFGCPSVIAFNGYKWKNPDDPKSGEISREEGFENCVKGLKKLASHAEKKKVTVCLEHLNTRDDSHPMKGHPGYQGDDLDYVVEIIKKVGSDRVKLLFDVYHVQIMHGDVIRRLEQCKDVIGHIHTAGNPGRAELDENQEIYYPAIMRKLVDMKYAGYVGHEFIPTRNPVEGLTQAVKLCDV